MALAESNLDHTSIEVASNPSSGRGVLRRFFPHFFSRNPGEVVLNTNNLTPGGSVLDTYNLDSISRAADDLVRGEAIIANICGVQGILVDGSNPEAIEKVGILKERDLNENPLVIAASWSTRQRLIDFPRIPQPYRAFLKENNWRLYEVPHFFEYPVKGVEDKVGKASELLRGRIGAIFWADRYLPLGSLESALLARKPNAILVGSSANKHGLPDVAGAKEAYDTFATEGGLRVSRILQDIKFERSGPWRGSHTMLGFKDRHEIGPLRGGAVKVECFRMVYPGLDIPFDWKDPERAVFVDVSSVHMSSTYLPAA